MVRDTIKKMRHHSHMYTMTHTKDPNATKGLKIKFLDNVLSELGKQMFKTEEEEAQEEQEEEEEEEKTNDKDNSVTHNSSMNANDDLLILSRNTLKPSAISVTNFSKFKVSKAYSDHPSSQRDNSEL